MHPHPCARTPRAMPRPVRVGHPAGSGLARARKGTGMDGRVGQDPDEVDRLADEFDHRATELLELQRGVSARLASTVWSGPDRDRFEHDWSTATGAFIARVVEALRGASAAAADNARDQRAASGVA